MDSRWSCKPDLGPDGSTCSITYTLAEPLDVVGLNIGEFLVPSVFNKHGVRQYLFRDDRSSILHRIEKS